MPSRIRSALGLRGTPSASTIDIDPEDLLYVLGTGDEPVLVDVREPDEVDAWPMPGAINIPLGSLQERLDEIPRDRQVVVLCASGSRSRAATAFLSRLGFDVANLCGGMSAWGQVYDEAEVDLGSARIVQLRRRGKGCLSYLVGAGDEAFVVDPSLDVELYLDAAARRGWQITRVIDTHLHADHLSGVRHLASSAGASIHLNPLDAFAFDFEPLSHGERLPLPDDAGVSVATLHTPGHTEGSTLLTVEGGSDERAVLSGDTVFVDGVGRPDLAERAEEFARNLHRSLHEHVASLPDDSVVLPAHFDPATFIPVAEPVSANIGELKASLAAFSLSEEEFVRWATSRVTPRPPHYVEIVKANMGSHGLDPRALRHLEAGPNRCSA